jgi:hypothetical protein
MSRTSTCIATQSCMFLGLGLALMFYWDSDISSLFMWHQLVGVVSSDVCNKTLKAANLKAEVPSDREFSIWSSILYVLSVQQMFVSLGVAWEAVTGYTWSDASEGVAAFCFLLAALLSLAAAGMGLLGGARHLLSNENALVRVPVSIIFTPCDSLAA